MYSHGQQEQSSSNHLNIDVVIGSHLSNTLEAGAMLDPELMNKYGGCQSHFQDLWMFKASFSILDLVFLLLLPFNGRIGIKMIT